MVITGHHREDKPAPVFHPFVTLLEIQLLRKEITNSLAWALCPPFGQGNTDTSSKSFTKTLENRE